MSEAIAMSLSVSGYSPSYLTALFQLAASNHLHKTKSASSGGICLQRLGRNILCYTVQHTGGMPFHWAWD